MYILNPQVSYFLLQCATFQKTFFFYKNAYLPKRYFE